MKKPSLLFPLLVLCLLATASCWKEPIAPPTSVAAYVKQTVPYKRLPSVAADLLSLDVHSYADKAGPRPVVVYVHGGGWAIGDKANKLTNKLLLFSSLNYVFVSVNYRLSPYPAQVDNPSRVKYPDHNNDVADAVKWLIDNIAAYGGDPGKMVLLGHSSGAHLVALTGTSQQFLPLRGVSLSFLKGIASIDTEGYDVLSQNEELLYQNAFGLDTAVQRQASPLYNIAKGSVYPDFLVVRRGQPDRLELANAFSRSLQAAGVSVSEIDGSQYTHEGINDAIGDPDDTVVTPALKTFLQHCFQ